MSNRPADKRPTLTLKGEEFSQEFRSLLNKAAKKAGKTQAAFAAEVLAEASRRVLRGEAEGVAEVPVKPSDLTDLNQMFEDRFGTFKAQITADLRAEVQAAIRDAQGAEKQSKGFLARVFGRDI